ncbi:MAG: bifunctional diaminohydroxyphosphoribosylaminopyrimidine deaminase/5-amino-6-(5-phosphoribosylamino)uracil reductase RibD [Ferruginibacter sp.]
MTLHETYMQRCLELALLGAGKVAPNPMVGAVLVHNNIIIGEGFHQQYGMAHAEVNCINNVAEHNKGLIEKSTLYVSLEPCAHFGKTPPCADLIIAKKIPRVVIGCKDNYEEVNGKGIEKLRAAGVEVTAGVLEKEARDLNLRFFTCNKNKRPYIILKWAQTADGIIGNTDHSRLMISNEFTNRLVHRWRSEEAAIMVGTYTAMYDDPSLTVRLVQGKNPVRIVIDNDLKLPASLHLFDGSVPTIVFNKMKEETGGTIQYYKLDDSQNDLGQILETLFRLKIQSVLIEGGAALIQSFINSNYWDEARVITNTGMKAAAGKAAPVLGEAVFLSEEHIQSDNIRYYRNANYNL